MTSEPPTPEFVRVRREAREETVRIAEYSCFPRSAPEPGQRFGFTRDFSASGMCLGVDESESVGSLLRVTLRSIDGRPGRTALERVVWCSAARDGRYWLGLEQLSECERARVDI